MHPDSVMVALSSFRRRLHGAGEERDVDIDTVRPLDDIARAHADMEAGRATGKLVVDLC